MKEVKVFTLRGRNIKGSPSLGRTHEEMEKNLAGWLNNGWEIEGSGGRWAHDGFVILVRERQE